MKLRMRNTTRAESVLRATTRVELTPKMTAYLEGLLRLAARGSGAPPPLQRLRGAGRDLAYLRGFAALVEHQCADAEPDDHARRLGAVAGGLVHELDRLVRRLDHEIGLGRRRAWKVAGIRETHLLRIPSSKTREALDTLVQLGHAESLSEASPPPEPLRSSMAALTQELDHLGAYFAEIGEPIAQEVGCECRSLAGAIRASFESSVRSPLPQPRTVADHQVGRPS